jgi:hypothetical protein
MQNKNRLKVLLTGAGFSKNFKAPLAGELIHQIYNNKHIRDISVIQNAIKSSNNIEEAYSDIINNDDIDNQSKNAMSLALEAGRSYTICIKRRSTHK